MSINYRTPNNPRQQYDVRFPPVTLNLHTPHPDITNNLPMICALVCNMSSETALENTARMASFNLLSDNNWNNAYFEYVVKVSIAIMLEAMQATSTGSVSYADAVKKALILFISRVCKDYPEVRHSLADNIQNIADRNFSVLQVYESQLNDVVRAADYSQPSNGDYDSYYATGSSSFSQDAGNISNIFADSVKGPGITGATTSGNSEYSLMAANAKAFAAETINANKKPKQDTWGPAPVVQDIQVEKPSVKVLTDLSDQPYAYYGFPETPISSRRDVVEMFTAMSVATGKVEEKKKLVGGEAEGKPITDDDVVDVVDLNSSGASTLKSTEVKLIEDDVDVASNQAEAIQKTIAKMYSEPAKSLKRNFFWVGNPIYSECYPESILEKWKKDATNLRDLAVLMEAELKTLAAIYKEYGDASPVTDEAQLIKQISRKLTKRVNSFLKYSLNTSLHIDDIIEDSIALHSALCKKGADVVTAYEAFETILTTTFLDGITETPDDIEERSGKWNVSCTFVPDVVAVTSIPFTPAEMGLGGVGKSFILKPEVPLFGLLLFSTYIQAKDKDIDIEYQYLTFNDGTVFKAILRPLEKDFYILRMNT